MNPTIPTFLRLIADWFTVTFAAGTFPVPIVFVWRRCVDGQLVAHLECLAHRPDDPHRLGLQTANVSLGIRTILIHADEEIAPCSSPHQCWRSSGIQTRFGRSSHGCLQNYMLQCSCFFSKCRHCSTPLSQ